MERLTATDYYREALDILGELGSEALTIASLCDRLAVTKGSFYHHFGSMPTFVTQLLAYWETEHSDWPAVPPRVEPDPVTRLAVLLERAAGTPHAPEAAIRAWGRSNAEVAEVVARIDKRRERRLADAIAALGVERPRARLLGRLVLDALAGAQQREDPVDIRRLGQVFDEIRKLIVVEADPGLVARLAASSR